ncbi:MAG: HigA family addiction module antitoxin [Hydrogenophilus thermoluteolus]|jgi:addiction module HigA family antidote
METKPLPNIHPGEVLQEEFLAPLGLTPECVAHANGVSVERLNAILSRQAPITTDIALRLGKAFNTSAQFWLTLQSRYDEEEALRREGEALAAIPLLLHS